jgi:DNA ligase-1
MFRPMLAPHESPKTRPDFFEKLKFPLLISPKLDGIRCLPKMDSVTTYDTNFNEVQGLPYKVCKSREFLDLPSKQVQSLFAEYQDLDGELTAGEETETDIVYNRTQSHVMSEDKPHEDMRFRVFDCTEQSQLHLPFIERLENAANIVEKYNKQFGSNASMIEHLLCENLEELLEHESVFLGAGYEGVMMRNPFGYYKNGRGTFKEGLIYKLKRSEDDEGIIIDFIEEQKNNNILVVDALGYAKRSSSKEGKVGSGTLGKFIILYNELEQSVTAGVLTKAQRQYVWDHKEEFQGAVLKFRYFGKGIKNRPRHPRALGFRHRMDIDTEDFKKMLKQLEEYRK